MDDYYFFGDVGIERTPTPGTVWVVLSAGLAGDELTHFSLGRAGSDAEVLGAGNTFGPVLAATLADGREVAIKAYLPIKPEYDRDLLYQYASHEFRRGSQDLGPHFVRAYALLESQDQQGRAVFYLVMQLIRGPQLDAATEGGVSAANQVRLTRQVLEALQSLQDHELVWQDIKPANMMLDSENLGSANVVFIDHGSVRKLGAGTHVNSQHTEDYAAPETLVLPPNATSRVFTFASDIFSAGVTLLSAFTRGRPYVDETDEYRTLHGTPNLSVPELAGRVRDVLAGMLVRNPSDRATLAELRRVIDGTPPAGWDPDPYRVYSAGESQAEPGRESAGMPSTPPTVPAAPTWVPLPPRPTLPDAREQAQPETEMVPLLPPETAPADRSLLLEWAGTDSRWVRDDERKIYGAIGIALCIYFAYVCLGAAAVGWQATESVVAAVIGGVVIGPLLGTALVNLDRSIVATVSPNLEKLDDGEAAAPVKKSFGFWVGILVRTGVALVAAFVIGEAINVQIHAGDVDQELEKARITAVTDANSRLDASYEHSLTSLQDQVDAAVNAREDVMNKPEQLKADAQKEREGEGPTGKPGCGSECEAYLTQAKEAEATRAARQSELDKAVADAEKAKAEKQAELVTAKATAEASINEQVAGPLARSHALITKALSDKLMLAKYVGLIVLFMAIELTAILIKLLTLNSTYERDMARRKREREYASQQNAGVRYFHIKEAAAMNKQLTRDLIWVQGAERAAVIDKRAQDLARDLGMQAPRSSLTKEM